MKKKTISLENMNSHFHSMLGKQLIVAHTYTHTKELQKNQ